MTEPTHRTPSASPQPTPRVARRAVMVGAAALTGLAVAPLPAASATGPGDLEPLVSDWRQREAATVAAIQRRWIFGYDKEPGGPSFDITTALGDFYDFQGSDVLLYDDLAPDGKTATSAVEYGSFFIPLFDALARAEHAIETEPSAVVSADLATSFMVFIGRFTAADGSISGIRTHSTLAFRRGWRRGQRTWRIVREHNCSAPLSAQEVDDLFALLAA